MDTPTEFELYTYMETFGIRGTGDLATASMAAVVQVSGSTNPLNEYACLIVEERSRRIEVSILNGSQSDSYDVALSACEAISADPSREQVARVSLQVFYGNRGSECSAAPSASQDTDWVSGAASLASFDGTYTYSGAGADSGPGCISNGRITMGSVERARTYDVIATANADGHRFVVAAYQELISLTCLQVSPGRSGHDARIWVHAEFIYSIASAIETCTQALQSLPTQSGSPTFELEGHPDAACPPRAGTAARRWTASNSLQDAVYSLSDSSGG